MHKFVQSENTNTRTQKEALSADLGGGEEPGPTLGERRGKAGQGRGRAGHSDVGKSGPESLRLTSFIYKKWYIYKYS